MKNNTPFFSIIVPIYNVEDYLADCLDSIQKQSFKDFEIICVEDESTDNSKNILYLYADRSDLEIRIYENTHNVGLSASRNNGIFKARGRYLVFVDSDDKIDISMLDTLYNILKIDDMDIIYFNKENLGNDDFSIKLDLSKYSKVYAGNELFCIFEKDNITNITAYTAVYNKDYVLNNNILFYEGIVHEDYLYYVKAILGAKKVRVIDDVLYYYRRRKDSIMSEITEARRQSIFVVMMEIARIWSAYATNKELDEAFYSYLKKRYRVYEYYNSVLPKEKSLHVGRAVDEFFYDIIQCKENLEYKIIPLTYSEQELIKNAARVWIYGAGMVASVALDYLDNNKIKVAGLLVTNLDRDKEVVKGIKVFKYNKQDILPTDVVIIAMREHLIPEIDEVLKKDGITKKIILRAR
ncbi:MULTISPECIES: glycosyltransferase [unclassified Butyrivibrio]|uniref:glycosyltransferase n=1 Tax=unclassified Butyrivibrio TaxID=2639466 RepID=UPI00040D287E|nr:MULTISPECIES: glycosyltransferase [unclassified Butyrivibrio]